MFISKSRHGKATRNGPENRYWIGSDHKYVQYFNVIARFILHQFLLFRPSYINEIFSLLFLYSVWPEEYCYSLKYRTFLMYDVRDFFLLTTSLCLQCRRRTYVRTKLHRHQVNRVRVTWESGFSRRVAGKHALWLSICLRYFKCAMCVQVYR